MVTTLPIILNLLFSSHLHSSISSKVFGSHPNFSLRSLPLPLFQSSTLSCRHISIYLYPYTCVPLIILFFIPAFKDTFYVQFEDIERWSEENVRRYLQSPYRYSLFPTTYCRPPPPQPRRGFPCLNNCINNILKFISQCMHMFVTSVIFQGSL